jgi:tetratricopeptide (TPR) repeat protein
MFAVAVSLATFFQRASEAKAGSFLVRQAKYLVDTVPKLVSPYERGIIAQGLESIDDATEAYIWFRDAIDQASHEFDKLILLRRYARFLFRSGREVEARKQLERATKVAGSGDRYHVYQRDTYERWALLEYDFGDHERVMELLDKASAEYRKVSPLEFQKRLLLRLEPLRNRMLNRVQQE